MVSSPQIPPVVQPLNPPPPPDPLPPPAETSAPVGAAIRRRGQQVARLGRRRVLLTPGGARGDVTVAPGQRLRLLGE